MHKVEEMAGSSISMRWWEQEVGQEVEQHRDDYIFFLNNWLGAVP